MQRVSKNHTALFGWVFSTGFMSVTGIFTYITLRDGGVPDFPDEVSSLILGAFWICGLAVTRHLFHIPLYSAHLTGGDLVLRKRWLVRQVDVRLPKTHIQDFTPKETKDSEGDPYFEYILMLPDNKKFVMFEGHSRENIEAKIADFKRAIKSSLPPSTNPPLVS